MASWTPSPYPGDARVQEDGGQGCYDRFATFVGLAYEQSLYEFGIIQPTARSWSEVDDREVLCLIMRLDGTTTTGSAAGTGI